VTEYGSPASEAIQAIWRDISQEFREGEP
jgi:hypothetical protein